MTSNHVVVLNTNKYAKPIANSPDNLQSLVKRAEDAVKVAKEQADKVQGMVDSLGNPVVNVNENKGEIVITQLDGTSKGIKFTKTVNGLTPDENGNIDINNQFLVKFLD